MERETAGFEHMLANHEARRGAGDPLTIAARAILTNACRLTGRSARAVELAELNVVACEAAFGGDDPRTLTARDDLGRAYSAANKGAGAAAVLRQALWDCGRALGRDHPVTMLTQLDCCNLAPAATADDQLQLSIRAFADAVRVSGSDHPETMYARQLLSMARQRAGQPGEAIALAKENLGICPRILGPADPAVFTCQRSLGTLYWQVGRSVAAIPLLEEASAGYTRAMGPGNSFTLEARNSLSAALRRAGRTAEAMTLLEETTAAAEQSLEPGAAGIASLRISLGTTYFKAGRTDDGILLYERALAELEQVHGQAHPHALRTRSGLAFMYRNAGRQAESFEAYARVLAIRTAEVGPDDPAVERARAELECAQRGASAPVSRNKSERFGRWQTSHPGQAAVLSWLGVPLPSGGRAGPMAPASRLGGLAVSVLLVLGLALDAVLPHLRSHSTLQLAALVTSLAGAALVTAMWLALVVAQRRSQAARAGLPAGSAVGLRMFSAHTAFRLELAARFGVQVADETRRLDSARMLTGLAIAAGPLAEFAFLAGAAHAVAPSALVIGVSAAFGVVLARLADWPAARVREAERRLLDAARAALNFDSWVVVPVDQAPADYEAWYRDHGLQAYPSGRPRMAADLGGTAGPAMSGGAMQVP